MEEMNSEKGVGGGKLFLQTKLMGGYYGIFCTEGLNAVATSF